MSQPIPAPPPGRRRPSASAILLPALLLLAVGVAADGAQGEVAGTSVGVAVDGSPVAVVSTPSEPTSAAPTATVALPPVSTSGPPSVSVSVGGRQLATTPPPPTGLPEASVPVGGPAPPAPSGGGRPQTPGPTAGSRPSPATADAAGDPPGSPLARAASSPSAPAGAGHRTRRPPGTAVRRESGPRGGAAARTPADSPSARVLPATPLARASPRHDGSGGPLAAIGRDLPLPLPVPDWSKPIIALLILVAAALGLRAAFVSRRARRLEVARSRLVSEVAAMQAALVPELPRSLAGVDVSVAYRPAEGPAAGGDFYDVFTLGPGRVALILGDVAGHGPGALEQAALTRYTVRAYLQAGLSPREALALAGKALANPGCELLATVAAAVFEAVSGTLTYALAGHPAPILTGLELPDPPAVCCSPPLGWDMPTGRRQSTVALPAGASACFFTDGLTEARCSGPEMLFGRDRLRGVIESLDGELDAKGVLEGVRGGARATPDDMAACVLTSRAQRPTAAAPWAEELEVDPRDLAFGRLRRFLDAIALPAPDVDRLVQVTLTIAVSRGSALLHLEHRDGETTVTVSAPGAEPAATIASAEGSPSRPPLQLVPAP